MAVSVLGLLVPVAIFIAIGIALAFAASRGRAVKKIADPSCGKCHYNVRGLTTFTCPECGSDLREVGIITPKRETPGGTLTKNIIGWTALVMLLTAIGFSCVMSVFVKLTIVTQSGVILARPTSGGYDKVKISATTTITRRGQSVPQGVGTTQVDIELNTPNATSSWPDVGPITSAQVLAKLKQDNITGDEVKLKVEADGIASVVQAFIQQGATTNIAMPSGFQKRSSTTTGTVTSVSRPPRVLFTFLPLAIWLGGIILMVRDYTAQRRRASAN